MSEGDSVETEIVDDIRLRAAKQVEALKAYHADIAGLPFKDGDLVRYVAEGARESGQTGVMKLLHVEKTMFGVAVEQDILYFVSDRDPAGRVWMLDMDRKLELVPKTSRRKRGVKG